MGSPSGGRYIAEGVPFGIFPAHPANAGDEEDSALVLARKMT
jgi:hypothetical protein